MAFIKPKPYSLQSADKFVDCRTRKTIACLLAMTAKLCHFEPFVKRRKIQRNLKHTLNLWILRCAQYDKVYQYNKTSQYDNGFVILSE